MEALLFKGWQHNAVIKSPGIGEPDFREPDFLDLNAGPVTL